MKSNKALWAERHAQGKSKLDVAIETQMSADHAQIEENVEKFNSKKRKLTVDSKAEARKLGEEKAAKIEADAEAKRQADAEAAAAQAEAEAANEAEKEANKDNGNK